MSQTLSRVRSAWNQTLVTSATTGFDALARYYGLPRPSGISQTAWRRALIGGNGYRGEPHSFQAFLEGALSDFDTVLTVTLDPSRPTSLYSGAAEFTQDLVGRFVRLPQGLYRVGGPADVAATFGEVLDLVAVPNVAWDTPDWTVLMAPLEVEARFLPFFVVEDQAGPPSQTTGDESGTVTILLYPEVVGGTPPTFMVDSDSGAARPVGEPDGGFILGDVAEEGSVADGPHPLFLSGDAVFASLAYAMRNLLPAPLKIQFVAYPEAP